MSKFNDVLNKKAVALSYDENKNRAPIIVASGMGYVAEKMVEIARESGVPVYEDNSQAIIDIYVYFLQYVPGEKKENSEETEEENEEEAEGAAEPEDAGTQPQET